MVDIQVTKGNNLVVDSEILNIGDSQGQQDILFLRDSTQEDIEADLVLQPDASESLTWILETDSLATGTYDIIVQSDNDESQIELEIIDSAIPDSGVMRLTFDNADTESGTALDSWGNNDGTINGATTGVSGQLGEAYDFNASNTDYIQLDNPVWDVTSSFSFGTWVNFDTVQGRLMNTNDNTNGIRLWYDSGDNVIETYFENSDSFDSVTTSPPSTGTWVHYVTTYDADTDEAILYEDGSEVASKTLSVSPAQGENMRIGGRDQFVDGRLDDPRVYDKVLSASEVSNWYNTGSISG